VGLPQGDQAAAVLFGYPYTSFSSAGRHVAVAFRVIHRACYYPVADEKGDRVTIAAA
jgi:hypothetical protein